MFDTKLQTPIDAKVLKKAKAKAKERGFSSVNEVVRMILKDFSDGKMEMSFYYPQREISEAKELQYLKDVKHTEKLLKTGKIKSYSTAKELLEDL